jgi:hypothetical protein
VTLRGDEACTVRLVVRVRGRIVARRRLHLTANRSRTVTIRQRRARVTVTAVDAAGNRAVVRRALHRRATMARHEL